MEQTNNKYSTGKPMDIPEDLAEREIATKEWAEGNEHLEEALQQCILHGLQTRASCAGHKGFGNDPYLGIEITEETRKRIYNILNVLFKHRKYISSIDIFNDIDRVGTPKSHIAIHSRYKTRNKIFDLIAEGAKGEIDLEKCDPIIQRMIKIEQGAKQSRLFFNAIAYQNIGPIKAVVLINDTIKNNRKIYSRTKIKHAINPCLTDEQVLDKLSSICRALDIYSKETKQTLQGKHIWKLTEQEKENRVAPMQENNKPEGKEDVERDF